MSANINIAVSAQTQAAEQAIRQFASRATKNMDGIGGAVSSIKNLVAGLGIYFTGRAILGAIESVTQASARQQDAVNSLNSSLRRIGQYSEGASRELQNYASQLQSVTRFGDEAIIEQMAFAQSMGATAEQSKVIVAAATDMSSALKIDLNSAVRNIAKTLGGFAGELGEVIPALKNLTAEQLRAGAGVELLAQMYRGMAQRDLMTFSGAVQWLENLFGDLQESLGNFITSSPGAIAAIKELGEVLREAILSIQSLGNQGDPLGRLIVSFARLGEVLGGVILPPLELVANLVHALGVGIGAVAAEVAQLAQGNLKEALSIRDQAGEDIKNTLTNYSVSDAVNTVSRRIREAVEKSRSTIEKAGRDLAGAMGKGAASGAPVLDKNIQALKKKLEDIGLTQIQILQKERDERLRIIRESALSAQEKAQLTGKVELDYANRVAKARKQQLTEEQKQRERILSIQQKELELMKDRISRIGEFFSAGASALMGQGKEDAMQRATSLIAGGAGAIANAFLPGSGPAVTQIVTMLAQGPEKVKEMITSLMDAIPDVLMNITESMPAVLESLGEKLPELINRLIKDAPKSINVLLRQLPKAAIDFVENLIKNIPEFIESFAREFPALVKEIASSLPEIINRLIQDTPKIVWALISGLVKSIPKIIVAFKNGVVEAAKSFLKALIDGVKGGVKSVGGFLGKIGKGIVNGVKKVGSAIGHFFGSIFQVQSPAGASGSGETENPALAINTPSKAALAIPRSQSVVQSSSTLTGSSQSVARTLDDQGVQNVTLKLHVGEDELAKVMLNLSRRGFRLA